MFIIGQVGCQDFLVWSYGEGITIPTWQEWKLKHSSAAHGKPHGSNMWALKFSVRTARAKERTRLVLQTGDMCTTQKVHLGRSNW